MGMSKEEAAEFLSNSIPEEDALIILKIIKKGIEELGLEPHKTPEEFAAFTNEERYAELITPRVTEWKPSEELSCVFFRFVGDETPLAEAFFYPIEAVWSFLDTARKYFNGPGTTLTPEEIEKFSFNKAVDMFCIMVRIIQPRIKATMISITEETINEWHRQENERFVEYYSRQGVEVFNRESNILKIRQNLMNEHKREVGQVWEHLRKTNDSFQKMRFAEYYELVFEHWDTISLLYRSKKDWDGYAKRPGFEDTPDDLLEELKGSHHRGMSLKALEHAARRAGLINPECKEEKVLEKRKNGIAASGFSEATLYKYLEEGRKVLEQYRSLRTDETTLLKAASAAE